MNEVIQVKWCEVDINIKGCNSHTELVHTGLIEQRKCAGSEEIVKERITKLQQQWEYLVQKSNEKSQHLKESNQQQQFNTNVKDLDFWLGEVRGLNIAKRCFENCLLFKNGEKVLCLFRTTLTRTITLHDQIVIIINSLLCVHVSFEEVWR